LKVLRKTVSAGLSSVGIILPADWRKSNDIGPGQVLELELKEDSITIRKSTKEILSSKTKKSLSVGVESPNAPDGSIALKEVNVSSIASS
jgi:bifunctional DNA-binding transcriptional regulator/antitoxin component of YhaV-PrlF toxin-antitoxin module